MKYLIFFLSFFLSTGVSAQLELDTFPNIYAGSTTIITPQVYYSGTTDLEMRPFHGNEAYRLGDLSDLADLADLAVIEIQAASPYLNIPYICEIIDAGTIRYGMVVEAADGVTSITHVLLLPEQDNGLWEKLKNNQ